MSSAMDEQGEQGESAGFGCYVYAVGMRMRDGDTIGEELQDRDARMRPLCSGVGDKMMPEVKRRYENAEKDNTTQN